TTNSAPERRAGLLQIHRTMTSPPEPVLDGILHVFVAFDWGDELDLERARTVVAAEKLALPRRRRTPTSIAYRPPPLRLALTSTSLDWPELGALAMQGEVTIFDFAGVSLAWHIP